MEEILSEAMKKLEESKEASNVDEPRKRTHSQISLNERSKKTNPCGNVIIQQDNENNSDLDLSDNELDLFSKADSSFRKTSSIRSVRSGSMNRPKSSNPQVYQPPSKLDNWNTEHRYEFFFINHLVSSF